MRREFICDKTEVGRSQLHTKQILSGSSGQRGIDDAAVKWIMGTDDCQ